MKSSIGLIGFLAALASLDNNGRPFEFSPEEREIPVPKGHKPFNINGIVVYALNEKNARRKAAKIKPKAEPDA